MEKSKVLHSDFACCHNFMRGRILYRIVAMIGDADPFVNDSLSFKHSIPVLNV